MFKNKSALLIWIFAITKLILHFTTNRNYGLHRDEYLYFDQGKHLAWGFYEVPPLTPFIGTIADLFGGSIFAIRLFPALAGLIIIVLACRLVKDIGGGFWAIFITGFSLTFTTSLLGTNSLFQPVSFNQLFWFLIAYVVVQLIRTDTKQLYYLIGIFIGLGILTKYSVLFYITALVLGILLTKQKHYLLKREFLYTVIMAMLIALPNIIWQINHGFPVLIHMRELGETQLVHVDWSHFISSQMIAHKGFTILWVLGLIGLFTIDKLKPYKSMGLAFLFTLTIIGLLHGKSYYTLGAFLILFPFGGYAAEKYIKQQMYIPVLGILMFVITLPFYPLSIPILKVDQLKRYTGYLVLARKVPYFISIVKKCEE